MAKNVLLIAMNQKLNEIKKIEKISQWYTGKNWGFYTKLVYFDFLSLKPYFKKGNALEMGCADGAMTQYLVKVFNDLSVVDASKRYINKVTKTYSFIKGYASLFEDFKPPEKYKNIIMAHILEHVNNPIRCFKKAKKYLQDDGVILIIVPNANSLHRQAGVKMGLLKKCTDLNKADKKIGHRRVYTIDSLKRDIKKAGFKIRKTGGVFLKPLSNQQIDQDWSEKMINAFYELGKEYPEIAAEIFVVCVL